MGQTVCRRHLPEREERELIHWTVFSKRLHLAAVNKAHIKGCCHGGINALTSDKEVKNDYDNPKLVSEHTDK